MYLVIQGIQHVYNKTLQGWFGSTEATEQQQLTEVLAAETKYKQQKVHQVCPKHPQATEWRIEIASFVSVALIGANGCVVYVTVLTCNKWLKHLSTEGTRKTYTKLLTEVFSRTYSKD